MKDDGYTACQICATPAMGSGDVCCVVGRDLFLARKRHPGAAMDVLMCQLGMSLATSSPTLSPVVAALTLRRLLQLEQAEGVR